MRAVSTYIDPPRPIEAGCLVGVATLWFARTIWNISISFSLTLCIHNREPSTEYTESEVLEQSNTSPVDQVCIL